MKNVILIIVLVALGAGGAWMYLKVTRNGGENSQKVDRAAAASLLHNPSANLEDLPQCRHKIPEAICAFCHPNLIEDLGFCHGHNVAEAFCTRCSPVLIEAFKVENDWCIEHALPESQCDICKGGRTGDASS